MIKTQSQSEWSVDNNPLVIGNLEQKELPQTGLIRTEMRIITCLMLGDIPTRKVAHLSLLLFTNFA